MVREIEKRQRGDGALGERVRRRRKELGLTAKELARLVGVSASYISQLEHGKQDRPSLDVLGTLASALGVAVAELLGEAILVVGASELSPVLKALAEEFRLDEATVAMLSNIEVDGRRPTTREGWLLILLAIRHACSGGTGRAVIETASA